MRKLLSPIILAYNLAALVLRQSWRITAAIARQDAEAARAHARMLCLSLLDDANRAILAWQRIRRRPKLEADKVDRVLIVKLDLIGDMVTTTPAFDALLKAYPHAKLDIVAHPGPLSLLEVDERIAEGFEFATWLYHPVGIRLPGLRAWRLITRLLKRRYPLVVILRGSGPFLLLGFTSRLAVTSFEAGEPVVQRYLRALEPVLGPQAIIAPRLYISSKAEEAVRARLGAERRGTGPRIAIHAMASCPTKIWPPERFAAVADELQRSLGAEVHFLGSPGDKQSLATIDSLAKCVHAFHIDLQLPEVAAFLAACDLFLGNDSGLAHMAAAVGTKIVVIWLAPNLSMARPMTGPEEGFVLYHDVPCRDTCPEFRCNNEASPYECLRRTRTDDVIAAVRSLLDLPTISPEIEPRNGSSRVVVVPLATRRDDSAGSMR